MRIKATVTIDNTKVKQLEDASYRALRRTAKALLDESKAMGVIPKNVGTLEESGYIEEFTLSVYQIVFSTPYARRLYWHPEYNFRTDKNPNAKGLWMQDFIDGYKFSWVCETYVKFLKEEAGGLIE